MENAIYNLGDLEQWFLKKETPYYTLYAGRGTNQNMVIHRNREDMTISEAWMQIKQDITISSHGGGVFTLVTRQDKNKENILNGKIMVAINQPDSNQARMNGINNPQIGADAINKAVNDAIEVYDLKRKVEELEGQLEAAHNQSFIERIGNRLADSEQLPQLAEAFIAKILGPASQPVTTTIHGMPGQKGNIEESLEKIQTVFPHPEELLHNLSNWIVANPDMAKSIFDQQIMAHEQDTH